MNLSKLDGFGRVQTQTPPQHLNGVVLNGRRKKSKRAARRGGGSVQMMKRAAGTSHVATHKTPQWVNDIWHGEKPKTKRQAKELKRKRMNGEFSEPSGSEPNIGFSRVYEYNQPTTEALQGWILQGFGRIQYTNRELQGLSLQGIEILQGYGMGDEDDLEDWNYLLSIEHPDTLQGFPSWVLNGKAERKARQAKRKAKRAAKKQKRAATKSSKQASKSKRVQKRQNRKAARQDRSQRKKEVKTARKEERLRAKKQRAADKESRKAERLKRKQQKLDDRKERQRLRQETKREKAAMKAQAKVEKAKAKASGRGRAGDMFAQISESAIPLAANLMDNSGDFADFSAMDFDSFDLPGGLDEFIGSQRGLDSEDALQNRDLALELMDEEEEEEFVLDPFDPDEGESNSMMMPLLLAAGVGLAMTSDKKKKKRK